MHDVNSSEIPAEQWQVLLEKAAKICVNAHRGQRDKVGKAYFQHPMRVAMRCKNDDEKIVALLHDVMEDADLTPEYLYNQGFPQSVVDGVVAVSKRPNETYEKFISRVARNRLGRVVKIHDLEDNLDVFRLEEIDAEMMVRYNKYLKAYRFLVENEKSMRRQTISTPSPSETVIEKR